MFTFKINIKCWLDLTFSFFLLCLDNFLKIIFIFLIKKTPQTELNLWVYQRLFAFTRLFAVTVVLCSKKFLCFPGCRFGCRITVVSTLSCEVEHVLLMTGLGLAWALFSKGLVENCRPSTAGTESLTRKAHCLCVLLWKSLCVIICVQRVHWELTTRNGNWARSN